MLSSVRGIIQNNLVILEGVQLLSGVLFISAETKLQDVLSYITLIL